MRIGLWRAHLLHSLLDKAGGLWSRTTGFFLDGISFVSSRFGFGPSFFKKTPAFLYRAQCCSISALYRTQGCAWRFLINPHSYTVYYWQLSRTPESHSPWKWYKFIPKLGKTVQWKIVGAKTVHTVKQTAHRWLMKSRWSMDRSKVGGACGGLVVHAASPTVSI